MKRIYEDAAYAADPGAYWSDTRPAQDWPRLSDDLSVDVAVIGGGFTGLNAALALAEQGVRVAVFEAERPGWGASGRNGGFCCLGGAKLSDAALRRRYGADDAGLWHDAQVAAVDHVSALLDRHAIDADTHSEGEVMLAHSPRALRRMRAGPGERMLSRRDLAEQGMGGTWHGGLWSPVGFALNPQKYHDGLARAAIQAGAQLFARSPVTGLHRDGAWTLQVGAQSVRADTVILATNGYSSEDLPDWLSARYLPVQSSVIVTRPLTAQEQQAQGWWSHQMAYDSRFLLHYFRLMPDGRFLFGMRGGLDASARARQAIKAEIRRDFARLFPAWADVKITHDWDGLVCLMRGLVPFVGQVPGHAGLYAAMGFHGNGVAMGSYAGAHVAAQITGRASGPAPAFLRKPPARFPLGRFRRVLLRPAYMAASVFDL
ncbi:NAD(P)/FAD-dependent oxidoreductase [Tropicibacter alexandrii]|uniref:NAD(P)/FAD-dependent oxidoreductase n=1 Tax=Tropicibacter alexandrii TaxID=2267683 RepID=UPI000EF5191D|nr:FAD-dependent oxidoreductase [Tropicibacter alexandrii]